MRGLRGTSAGSRRDDENDAIRGTLTQLDEEWNEERKTHEVGSTDLPVANAAELECYVASALNRLENQALGIKARKRMFTALWLAFTDDERRAFLARLDADGTFHGKGAA